MKTTIKALLLSTALMGPTYAQDQLPLLVVPWSPLNPDMVGIYSTDPSAGAAAVTVPPNIPVGQPLGFRIHSDKTGDVDIGWGVLPEDTPISIANGICDQINAIDQLKDGNVACQIQPGIAVVGITHFNNNAMTIIPHEGFLQIQQGSLAWDAGGILVCDRVPPEVYPPPGSSICQIIMGGASSTTPGAPTVQYGMIQTRVLNPDPANIAGQIEVYTAKSFQGNALLRSVGTFWRGQVLCTNGQCPPDMGEGTLNLGGLFIGSRKVCENPTTHVLTLAIGATCP